MRMQDLRKIEERFEIASQRVDEMLTAIGKDIAGSGLSEPELKHAIQGAIASKLNLNDLLATSTIMAYRLASGWPYAPESSAPEGFEQVVDTDGTVVAIVPEQVRCAKVGPEDDPGLCECPEGVVRCLYEEEEVGNG